MEKKTKNIIVSIIIIILIICLAFTIADNKKTKREAFNFGMPNTWNRSEIRKGNYRFKSRDDNTTTKEEKENDDTSSNEVKDEFRQDNCKCMNNIMPEINNQNNIMSFNRNESNNSSLKITLITIESFLLGGSVMYLILNNINNELKEGNAKNKTRRA